MEIEVKIPGFYTMKYGIDDQVYWYCRRIYRFFLDKNYSSVVPGIVILPMIQTEESIQETGAKEESVCRTKSKYAAASLFIDFERYHEGTLEERKALINKNVLDSIKVLSRRCKIDYKQFEADFNKFIEEDDDSNFSKAVD